MQPNLTPISQALTVLGFVVAALLQSKKILKQAARLLPKGTGPLLIKQLRRAYAYLARESTPPTLHPMLARVGEALLSAYFYVQAFRFLVLFLLTLLGLVMSSGNPRRLVVAACFALLVSWMFWFCFTHAEKLRVKLRTKSLALW